MEVVRLWTVLVIIVGVTAWDNQRPDPRLVTSFSEAIHDTFDPSFWDNVQSSVNSLKDINPDNVTDWTKCLLGFADILQSIANNKSSNDDFISALKMIDSGTKLPVGLIRGNAMDLGQFDECLSVERNNINVLIPNSSLSFRTSYSGQHCLISLYVIYPPNLLAKPKSEEVKWVPNSLTLTISRCYPSTCKPEMIQQIWETILTIPEGLILSGYNISVYPTVQAKDCHVKGKSEPFDGLDWSIIFIVALFICIGATCTAIDAYSLQKQLQTRKPTLIEQAVISFSVYTNGSKLFSTKQNASQMNCINGLKFFSICWVVLGHKYYYLSRLAIMNGLDVKETVSHWDKMLIYNAVLSVDTFFLMSGMLNVYVFLNSMERSRKYNIFSVISGYIHRYIRLTPSYLMMIGITSTFLIRTGSGPLWDRLVGYEKDNCRLHWWSSLLYLNNYLNPESNCMMQSWYLAVDMQLFWLSPFVVYPLYRWPTVGLFNVFILLAASVASPFAVSYTNNIRTTIPINPDPDRFAFEFDVLYLPTHTKTVSYVFGILVGYIIQKLKKGKLKFKLNLVTATIGWILGLTSLLYSVFGCYPLYQPEQSYTQLETSLFLAFYRLLWSIGVGWIIFACISGYGGIVDVILSFKLFGPLGRISYCIYLTHISVIIYKVATLRTAIFYQDYEMVISFGGEIMLICVIATLLSLLLESPMMGIEKIIFSRGGRTQTKHRQEVKRPTDPELAKGDEEAKDDTKDSNGSSST